MKNIFLSFGFLLIMISGFSQQNSSSTEVMNLGFEIVENGQPQNWVSFGTSDYFIGVDSTVVKSGNYSAVIEFKQGNPDFRAYSMTLPCNYKGRKITLSGYIKTENVTDGYAGLWMRIDPSVAFDNMYKNGVKGTSDWTKYEITLRMNPEKTKQIVIGGLLVGKGKMWIDDLQVKIDGKETYKLKPYVPELQKAALDNEFDKGSGISTIQADAGQVENLRLLGMVWGFLKYYHPAIASGNFNWDYELFRILPQILKSENNKSRDEIFVNWIQSLGEFNAGKEIQLKNSDVKIQPDLDWISHSDFSLPLTELLVKVKNAQRTKKSYYIGLTPGIGNPDFKNENPYTSMKYPDAGFRLLALYRYWNMIQYYFPYRNLIEEDWKSVLGEFIPKFINAKDETQYTLAVLEIIGRVHDTHANIWGGNSILEKYSGLNYAPVELTFIENKPVVTSYFHEKYGKETGLDTGDVIVSINGRSVEEITQEKLVYSPASNYSTQLRDIALNLLRTNDTVLQIEYLRNNKLKSLKIKTFPAGDLNLYAKYQTKDTCFRLVGTNIAYINNGSLKRKNLPALWKEIKHTKGLIIDDRNYPSDFPIYALSRHLMPKAIPFVRFTKGSIELPGTFKYERTLKAGRGSLGGYKGKIVILVNEISQSSAEFHAMAYRVHPNATVIGSTTAGADGDVSRIILPGNIFTMISGIGVYYPNGDETQRKGIVPDIVCTPTIQGIREGRDELLEKAIEIINGSSGN